MNPAKSGSSSHSARTAETNARKEADANPAIKDKDAYVAGKVGEAAAKHSEELKSQVAASTPLEQLAKESDRNVEAAHAAQQAAMMAGATPEQQEYQSRVASESKTAAEKEASAKEAGGYKFKSPQERENFIAGRASEIAAGRMLNDHINNATMTTDGAFVRAADTTGAAMQPKQHDIGFGGGKYSEVRGGDGHGGTEAVRKEWTGPVSGKENLENFAKYLSSYGLNDSAKAVRRFAAENEKDPKQAHRALDASIVTDGKGNLVGAKASHDGNVLVNDSGQFKSGVSEKKDNSYTDDRSHRTTSLVSNISGRETKVQDINEFNHSHGHNYNENLLQQMLKPGGVKSMADPTIDSRGQVDQGGVASMAVKYGQQLGGFVQKSGADSTTASMGVKAMLGLSLEKIGIPLGAKAEADLKAATESKDAYNINTAGAKIVTEAAAQAAAQHTDWTPDQKRAFVANAVSEYAVATKDHFSHKTADGRFGTDKVLYGGAPPNVSGSHGVLGLGAENRHETPIVGPKSNNPVNMGAPQSTTGGRSSFTPQGGRGSSGGYNEGAPQPGKGSKLPSSSPVRPK